MRSTENNDGGVGESSRGRFLVFSLSDVLDTKASESSTTRLPLTVAKLFQIFLNTG